MSFLSLQSSQKTNLKTQVFALAYWAEMFRSFFGRIEKKNVLSKLTDLYLNLQKSIVL